MSTDYKSRALYKSILEDHGELREYHEKFLQAKNNAEEREKWVNMYIWEQARHAIGEEIVWYPEMERVMGEDGVKAADHDRAEHQESKEIMAKLSSLKATDPQHAILFAKMHKALEDHMNDEETNDLPKFESKITAEESERIAKLFERTKKFAPTRGHPSFPDKPPFETAAALLAAPVDKLRDMFTKFPEDA